MQSWEVRQCCRRDRARESVQRFWVGRSLTDIEGRQVCQEPELAATPERSGESRGDEIGSLARDEWGGNENLFARAGKEIAEIILPVPWQNSERVQSFGLGVPFFQRGR